MIESTVKQEFERGRGDRRRTWTLRLLTSVGLITTVYYFSWWGQGGRILSPWLSLALMAAALYHWTQLFSSWVIYNAAARRIPAPEPPAERRPTMDVFVTTCGEPFEMVQRSLLAIVEMRGEHRSWLLDDGDDPRLAALAERCGTGYLTRSGAHDAKAGNLNAALSRTDGELIVVFDVDHVPDPAFLERTIGYFDDPSIGFVQVMLTFHNEAQSWFARAAAETCYDFFNPTSMGMDRLGSATMIGSNALIRRTALESIGGYRPGLAEDLATSIALHGAGWKSAYVAEPLAPGLAPTSVSAWFTQQLKWARGVFEILLVDYPRIFSKLTWGQRLSYGVRMTYYWAGLVTVIHMVFTAGILIGGSRVAAIDLREYLLHLLPLCLVAFGIRAASLLSWGHPTVPKRLFWRSLTLIHATWPVYSLAWLMAVIRLPLRFRPTPKGPESTHPLRWLVPQIGAAAMLLCGVLAALFYPDTAYPGLLLLFAGLQSVPQLFVLWKTTRPIDG